MSSLYALSCKLNYTEVPHLAMDQKFFFVFCDYVDNSMILVPSKEDFCLAKELRWAVRVCHSACVSRTNSPAGLALSFNGVTLVVWKQDLVTK